MWLSTWWEYWSGPFLIWVYILVLLLWTIGIHILFVLIIKILSILKLLIRCSSILNLVLLVIPWSLWCLLLLYYVYFCIINICMIGHSTCLLTVFRYLLITMLIWISVVVVCISIICSSLKRVVSTSSRRISWVNDGGMLVFLFSVPVVFHRCLHHHVSCCSCLSFLCAWYGWEIILPFLLISVIGILILDSGHRWLLLWLNL